MNRRKLRYTLRLFTSLLFIAFMQYGCSREYSYEGGNATTDSTLQNDSTSQNDSTATPEAIIYCSLCHETDNLTLGSWNFKNHQSYFCGTTTNAGLIDNTTFTFFGPSSCSLDSGLVITAYMASPLDNDKTNVASTDVAFYYYNHKGSRDMFIKLRPLPFSLTVSRYVNATGIATGSFEGKVYKDNGDTTTITNGRFMVKLK